jgi:hypothetical protein
MKIIGSGHSVDSFGSREFSFVSFGSTDHGTGNLSNDRWDKDSNKLPPVPVVRCGTTIRWGGNTFHTIDGRPMCLEDTAFPDTPTYGELLEEDRFTPLKAPDSSPIRPRRSLEWVISDDDDESSDSGNENESECENNDCPIAWITPTDGDEDEAISKCTYDSVDYDAEDVDDDWSVKQNTHQILLLRQKLRKVNLINRAPEAPLLGH